MISSEQADDWASEFAGSTAYSLLPAEVKEHAQTVCAEFLKRAKEPTEEGARRALLEEMPELEIPDGPRAEVPGLLRTYLEWLQESGRLGEGHSLGAYVASLAPSYRERCRPGGGIRIPPVVKKTPDLGRNDPCPCGSGRKFKKCCGR